MITQTFILGQLVNHSGEKKELAPNFIYYTKINFSWIKHLNNNNKYIWDLNSNTNTIM